LASANAVMKVSVLIVVAPAAVVPLVISCCGVELA
jgi:hypothetical protein